MADIKVKKKENTVIKTLDRTAVMSSKIKDNIISVKDKAKETYEQNANSSNEYAENSLERGISNTTYYGVRKANQIVKKSVKKTAETIKNTKNNIEKGKQQIKGAKEGIKNVKKAGEKTIKTVKNSIKTAKRSIKATQKTIKTTQKTAKATVKATKQVAKTTMKVLQKTVQVVKATAKATIKAVQVTIKVAIAIIKAIIAAIHALISAIIAGGWVAVVIIIVIALIAMICCSIFGVFFSSEEEVGTTMSSVVSEINTEFMNKITEIQKNNEYDDYEINSNRAEWKDILAIYTVSISNGEEQTEVITLDDNKINKLKEIFWEMNNITYKIEEVEKNIETTDENGNTKTEKIKRKVLYIDITSKTVEEMVEKYNFNEKQKLQLAELQKEEYASAWNTVIYGTSNGSQDIVAVAKTQIGNVGGQPYWSWYGFSSRVDWCAIFVSWCANECRIYRSRYNTEVCIS